MNRSGITTKTAIFIALGILTLSAGAFGIANRKANNNTPAPTESSQPASQTTTQPPTTTTVPNQTTPDNSQPTTTTPPPKTTQSSAPSAPSSSPPRPEITRAELSGNNLIVRAFVQTFDAGECTMTAKSGSLQVIKTSGSSLQPSYVQCDGFSVAKSEFSGATIWSITVSYKLNGKVSVSDAVSVEIK